MVICIQKWICVIISTGPVQLHTKPKTSPYVKNNVLLIVLICGLGLGESVKEPNVLIDLVVLIKVIDFVPYRSVWLKYTVPANNSVCSTPLFRTKKNTGRIGQFQAIPAGTEKSFFF